MRKKRNKDETMIEKYQEKSKINEPISLFEKTMHNIRIENLDDTLNEEKSEVDADDKSELQFENLDIKVSNGEEALANSKKRKYQEIIDKDHFIPYKPKNFESEKALGINSSFERQAASASFDLIADDEVEMRRNAQKMKWDRKKKKFVSAQDDKAKKFKTESGNYISKSYKSNLYSKWLKTSKANESQDNNDNNGDNFTSRDTKKKFFGSSLEGFIYHFTSLMIFID